MTIHQLSWQQTQPITENTDSIFAAAPSASSILFLQKRLAAALQLLCPAQRRHYDHRFMLLKSSESQLIFSLLQQAVKTYLSEDEQPLGYAYHAKDHKVTLRPAQTRQDNFSAVNNCLYAEWFDSEMLFGCVRQPDDDNLKLQPGLVHKANGGILILSLRSLLSKPDLWVRLKNMVTTGEFHWFSNDDASPLPYNIPPLPLDLRIMLVGDRISLSELQDADPEFYQTSLYSEVENEISLQSEQNLADWASYIKFLQGSQNLPALSADAYRPIIKAAIRHTEDQYYLPLSSDWLYSLLVDAARQSTEIITAQHVEQALQQKYAREDYLVQRFRDEIFSNMITINTQEQIVGQINGLSVIEYPGYPLSIGEPTRLSCLVHFGDGEFIDIERKNELAGNIHSKGMMIMQAFITAEFALYHQLPFSASLVFEQSYSEVDGDSASLAGLCVLISALAQQPIDQQLAVTGSVDQFGHVQPIGGVNEKIESFFAICQHRGLTGQQGVIIPAANQRNLSLNDEVVEAIKNNLFTIWTVEHVSEALLLLTGIAYKDKGDISLYTLIQTRIQQLLLQDKKMSSGHWLRRWFKSSSSEQ
ncbi:Lon protease family protein [Utexia brackfieldae]|uniref:AAA family ATPase n=1 Tax=Utexia brackfieldae TaxID=3074108 RepID=UPI00370D2879